MDGTTVYPQQEQPPLQPAIELYPVSTAAEHLVDVQSYESYSIAASINSMFAEAETGADESSFWENRYFEQEYPNDTEAFRLYMKEVYRELKHSTAVQELRQAAEHGQAITKAMVESVFHAYERIVSTAASRLRSTLSPEQLQTLKQAGRNNLDWSYRGLLMERLTQEEGAPTKYSLEDFFLILNPKARKVQYMEKKEILKSLQHTMSLGTKEQLQHEVQLAREFAHQDMNNESITDEDLAVFESTNN